MCIVSCKWYIELRKHLFHCVKGCSLALDKVEAVFTNPPSSEPSAGPDLSVDFSKEVFSDITSHLDEFGMIKSGKYAENVNLI